MVREFTVWHVGGEDVHLRIPILKKLAQLGCRVGAVGTSDPLKFEGTGIDYYEIPLSRWINPLSDLKTILAIRRLVREHCPDIVHGFDTKPSILTPLAVASARNASRSVRTINGMGYLYSEATIFTRFLRPVYELAQRIVEKMVAHTIFQNSTDKQFFESKSLVYSDRCNLIHGSGVEGASTNRHAASSAREDLADELTINQPFVVTMVARVTRSKGVLDFLEAARIVRSKRQDVIFLLVGPYATEGAQRVKKEVLDSYSRDVIVTGPRQDVPAILSASSLFVLPTKYREGVPRSLLEAAMMGLPLVATRMPGCVDVVDEGNNGLLVDVQNPIMLAEAIELMVDNLDEWKSRAAYMQTTVTDKFGLDTVANEHYRLYRSLVI